MHKQIACLLLFCLYGYMGAAQNLVINGSFTDVNICTEFNAPCTPSAWFFVQRVNTRGYIYHENIKGAGKTAELNLLVATHANSHRDYWTTMLLHSLEPGEKYEVSLKLTSSTTGPNLNDIGLCFTDSMAVSWMDTLLQPKEWVSLLDAKAKQLKDGWFEVTKTFTATDRQQYLVIGNFSPLSNEAILYKRGLRSSPLFLSVTDIKIQPAHRKNYPDNTALKDSLYAIHKRHYILPHADSVAPPPPPPPLPKVDTLQINNVRFALNSYSMANPDTLDLLKPYLATNDVRRIIVIGYTDDSGTETYNQELSVKRAQEVARQLSRRFNIPEALVEVQGKGISTRYAQKELNRRVEIYIYH